MAHRAERIGQKKGCGIWDGGWGFGIWEVRKSIRQKERPAGRDLRQEAKSAEGKAHGAWRRAQRAKGKG
jgi:hypothetical protein